MHRFLSSLNRLKFYALSIQISVQKKKKIIFKGLKSTIKDLENYFLSCRNLNELSIKYQSYPRKI